MNTKEQILDKYRSRGEQYTWYIYQPIPLPGYEETYQFAGRKCTDRFEAIKQRLADRFGDKKLKILDIGCNNGYFLFEMAKLGHECVGIDTDPRIVEVCNFLADSNPLPIKPKFMCKKIDSANITDAAGYDVVFCFSVIHHFEPGEKIRFLNRFSRTVPYAFIELDGPDFGELELKTHYYIVDFIVDANDPYGKSTKLRKTWECDNRNASNIKVVNYVTGRGVFRVGDEVIKRERTNSQHTWIKTNLLHEIEMYENYTSRFFPKYLGKSIGEKYRELKIEYIEDVGKYQEQEVDELYKYLKDSKLFIIDFVRDSFLIDKNNKLRVIDLESLFNIAEHPIQTYLKTAKTLAYGEYEKQINFLKGYLKARS